MLRNFLRKFSFLMVSLLLVSCASQKSITPVEAEKEVKPVKETSSATEQAAASKAELAPENASITLNVQFDVVEFTEKNEREKLDNKEPHYATMPICTDKKATRKTTQWYKDCLSRYAGSYNPENALKTGKRTKVFEYNPPIHNCCNFAEEALKACGLAHCFDLGKSAGLDSKTGPLEE